MELGLRDVELRRLRRTLDKLQNPVEAQLGKVQQLLQTAQLDKHPAASALAEAVTTANEVYDGSVVAAAQPTAPVSGLAVHAPCRVHAACPAACPGRQARSVGTGRYRDLEAQSALAQPLVSRQAQRQGRSPSGDDYCCRLLGRLGLMFVIFLVVFLASGGKEILLVG